MIVSRGLNERLKTVPLSQSPPEDVVPYSVLPDKTRLASGSAPSLSKLCRIAKPVPLVLALNTVPQPELPPITVVPYKLLPDRTNPANGRAPSSGKPAKLCKFVKPVPS